MLFNDYRVRKFSATSGLDLFSRKFGVLLKLYRLQASKQVPVSIQPVS
jgi:hypothetical protein